MDVLANAMVVIIFQIYVCMCVRHSTCIKSTHCTLKLTQNYVTIISMSIHPFIAGLQGLMDKASDSRSED